MNNDFVEQFEESINLFCTCFDQSQLNLIQVASKVGVLLQPIYRLVIEGGDDCP